MTKVVAAESLADRPKLQGYYWVHFVGAEYYEPAEWGGTKWSAINGARNFEAEEIDDFYLLPQSDLEGIKQVVQALKLARDQLHWLANETPSVKAAEDAVVSALSFLRGKSRPR